jgi:hypothetical protein
MVKLPYLQYVKKGNCMVEEPSHVKQLSLNHVCKIGLRLVLQPPRPPPPSPAPPPNLSVPRNVIVEEEEQLSPAPSERPTYTRPTRKKSVSPRRRATSRSNIIYFKIKGSLTRGFVFFRESAISR